ncbi:MAG: HK97-gp10 family putative phage morphogenesis protein [Pseudomonadota bacterium]
MAIRGLKAHSARLKALPDLAVRNVGKALFAAGQLIENEAGLSITRGAVSGKGHVASTPGEAPNADTHRLDRSIETTRVSPLKVKVRANSGYASALEFGTSKVAARPFMRPARDKKKEEARDLVAKGLNDALKAARSR